MCTRTRTRTHNHTTESKNTSQGFSSENGIGCSEIKTLPYTKNTIHTQSTKSVCTTQRTSSVAREYTNTPKHTHAEQPFTKESTHDPVISFVLCFFLVPQSHPTLQREGSPPTSRKHTNRHADNAAALNCAAKKTNIGGVS